MARRLQPTLGDLGDAARALRQGKLVAFPTETVYGLGARADDDSAVAKIYAAKGRPADHPLIVHVADESGAVTTWRLESLPTAMLRKAGLTSEMLKGGGQKVTAVAIMARNGTPNLGWLLNLKYEDGHEYQLAGE